MTPQCSIYTAELQAILFALIQAYQSQGTQFMTFSDSLSALQALGKLKTNYPLLILIQDMLHKIDVAPVSYTHLTLPTT